jgi:hypothetical protein
MTFEPEIPMPQACWLQRQTNEHASLSPRKKEQFWSAQTQEEREALLATISPVDLRMPLSDVYDREVDPNPEPLELDEVEVEELRALMASWPVRTDCLEVAELATERIAEEIYDPAIHIAPLIAPLTAQRTAPPEPLDHSEDRLYALIAAAERMIAEISPEIPPPAPLVRTITDQLPRPALVRTITDQLPRPALVRTITGIDPVPLAGPGPGLQRSTNEHERLRPELRERFWSADAEEKADLLATLSPIESSFPGLPSLPPITAEEVREILRSMR